MPKNQISKADLERHLKQQVGFLSRSAKAYDDGFVDEFKRLALTIRVILHDTGRSISLLKQLGTKDSLRFLDTSDPVATGGITTHNGLSAIYMPDGGEPAEYVPMLDATFRKPRLVGFDEWWEGAAFQQIGGATFSRKNLILTAANQDGGGHVDPFLDNLYQSIQTGAFLGWTTQSPAGKDVSIEGAERAAIRQIAHEVLKTLDPAMKRQGPKSGGTMFGNISVVEVGGPPAGVPELPTGIDLRKIGRNEKCPCGSGYKFKRCHGRWLP